MSASSKSFRLAHDIIVNFLKLNGYEETLETFYKEGGDFCSLTKDTAITGFEDRPLLDIITDYYLKEKFPQGLEVKKRLDVPVLSDKEIIIDNVMALEPIDNIHYSNILSIVTTTILDSNSGKPVLISSSTDKSIKLSDLETGKFIDSIIDPNLGGAVLSLDIHPKHKNILLSSSMDFTVTLTDITKNELIKRWSHHKKFVNIAKFSPDGQALFSASYDYNLVIYKSNQGSMEDNQYPNFRYTKVINFEGRIETAAWTPDSKYIVVAVREDNYLYYINVEDYEILKYNLNNNGDNFVSFNIMDIKISPNKKHVLCATDHRSGRLILLSLFSSTQYRNYYGVKQDELSNPKIQFHPSGKYFFVNDDEFNVNIFDINNETPIGKLKGHTGIIRSLDFNADENLLISGSYDKTIRKWKF